MPDFCDFAHALRTTFFPRDRDVALQPNRNFQLGSGGDFYLSSTSNIYWPGNIPATMPDGNIVLMFSGAIGNIPTGWQLADGTNGTTDLRGMFLVGAGGSYSPGDTGGSDTVDISHQHGNGTLAADNESSHTHADGSYAAANDTHNHSDTFTIDNDAHTHDVTGTSGNESSHTHGSGTLDTDSEANHTHTLAGSTDSASSDDHPDIVDVGAYPDTSERAHTHGLNAGWAASAGSHDHSVNAGTTAAGSSHSHGDGSYAAASDTHNHGISGSVSNDTHNHDVTGTSGTGSAHGHTISGNTATGGDTTHDNRPAFYALAFIMRPV